MRLQLFLLIVVLSSFAHAQPDHFEDAATILRMQLSPNAAAEGMSHSFEINSQKELDTALRKIYHDRGEEPVIVTLHNDGKVDSQRAQSMIGKRVGPQGMRLLDNNQVQIDLKKMKWWMKLKKGRLIWTTVKIGFGYFSWVHFGPSQVDEHVRQGAFVFGAAVLAFFSTSVNHKMSHFYREKFSNYITKVNEWKFPDKLLGKKDGEKIKFLFQDTPFSLSISFAINFGFLAILEDASFFEFIKDPIFWSKAAGLAAFATFVTRSWKFATHYWVLQPSEQRKIKFETIDRVSMGIEGVLTFARPYILVGSIEAFVFMTGMGVVGYTLLLRGDSIFESWSRLLEKWSDPSLRSPKNYYRQHYPSARAWRCRYLFL